MKAEKVVNLCIQATAHRASVCCLLPTISVAKFVGRDEKITISAHLFNYVAQLVFINRKNA